MMQQDVLETPTRRIRLDGPVNFRDLGGYRSMPDGRTVRWRTVFRADGLDNMSESDVAHMVDTLGVRTIIDLRTEREIDLVGVGLVGATDIEWRNVSIIDETQQVWRDALDGGSIVDQYFAMLDGSSARFVEALELIAGSDAPLVFHCAAGKDRTGLLAALLLSILGVTDSEIGSDYAMTAEVLPALEARFLARADDPRIKAHYDRKPGWREAGKKMMTADHSTVSQVMTELRSRHGSPEHWLLEQGMSPNVVTVLRDNLLV